MADTTEKEEGVKKTSSKTMREGSVSVKQDTIPEEGAEAAQDAKGGEEDESERDLSSKSSSANDEKARSRSDQIVRNIFWGGGGHELTGTTLLPLPQNILDDALAVASLGDSREDSVADSPPKRTATPELFSSLPQLQVLSQPLDLPSEEALFKNLFTKDDLEISEVPAEYCTESVFTHLRQQTRELERKLRITTRHYQDFQKDHGFGPFFKGKNGSCL